MRQLSDQLCVAARSHTIPPSLPIQRSIESAQRNGKRIMRTPIELRTPAQTEKYPKTVRLIDACADKRSSPLSHRILDSLLLVCHRGPVLMVHLNFANAICGQSGWQAAGNPLARSRVSQPFREELAVRNARVACSSEVQRKTAMFRLNCSIAISTVILGLAGAINWRIRLLSAQLIVPSTIIPRRTEPDVSPSDYSMRSAFRGMPSRPAVAIEGQVIRHK